MGALLNWVVDQQSRLGIHLQLGSSFLAAPHERILWQSEMRCRKHRVLNGDLDCGERVEISLHLADAASKTNPIHFDKQGSGLKVHLRATRHQGYGGCAGEPAVHGDETPPHYQPHLLPKDGKI